MSIHVWLIVVAQAHLTNVFQIAVVRLLHLAVTVRPLRLVATVQLHLCVQVVVLVLLDLSRTTYFQPQERLLFHVAVQHVDKQGFKESALTYLADLFAVEELERVTVHSQTKQRAKHVALHLAKHVLNVMQTVVVPQQTHVNQTVVAQGHHQQTHAVVELMVHLQIHQVVQMSFMNVVK